MSTVASVAALVLAVIANVWNIGLVFVRRPRVSVETRTNLIVVPGGPNRDRIELTVINRGSEAVSISNIGLQPVDPSHMPRDYVRDAAEFSDRLPEGQQDMFPVRLEGRGVLRWVYGPDQLALFSSGIDVRGYAKTYQSFRWPWSRPTELTERTIQARRTELIRGP